MSAKKIDKYLPERPKKIAVPARVPTATIERIQAAAKHLKSPLCDTVDAALNMFADQALGKK